MTTTQAKTGSKDLQPLTVAGLKLLLATVPPTAAVYQASDEEGNSYSPVTMRGTVVEGKRLVFYPLLPEYTG